MGTLEPLSSEGGRLGKSPLIKIEHDTQEEKLIFKPKAFKN